MNVEFLDFVKIYGPLGVGWPVALYLLFFIIGNYREDIDSRIKLAKSIDALTHMIETHVLNSKT